MTEIALLTAISEKLDMVIKLQTAVVCGLGFIAAGQFWGMIRNLMRERHF